MDLHATAGGALNSVSFTAVLVAAYRALESEEPDAVFTDPLASLFAGSSAVETARQHGTEVYSPARPNMCSLPPAACGRKRRLGIAPIRTLYFDKVILAACHDDSTSRMVGMSSHSVKQVVMLGAGLDARPWRLQLPNGIRWFELDQQDVVVAKKALLLRFHAAVQAQDNSSSSFPLKAAEWHMLAADMQTSAWTTALRGKGFDASQSCLWHAEGLLNYLTVDSVVSLLREIRQVAAPGSILSATMMTEGTIAKHRSSLNKPLRQSPVWGASDNPEQVRAFFQRTGWQSVQFHEIAEVAMSTAPGFEYNLGPLNKQKDDFKYFFMIARTS